MLLNLQRPKMLVITWETGMMITNQQSLNKWIAHISAPTRELLYKQKRIIQDRWNGNDGYIEKRSDMNGKKNSPIQWFEFDDSIGISGRITNNLLGPTYNEDLGNFSTIENYGLLSFTLNQPCKMNLEQNLALMW